MQGLSSFGPHYWFELTPRPGLEPPEDAGRISAVGLAADRRSHPGTTLLLAQMIEA